MAAEDWIVWDDDEGCEEDPNAGDPVFDLEARTGGMWPTEADVRKSVSGKIRRSRDMSWQRNRAQTWVEIEDVAIVKKLDKSWLCRFPEGHERFVPISQTPGDFEPEVGTTVTLVVSDWISNKWDEEGPPEREEPVVVENCCCVRETDRALRVKVPGFSEELWIPKSKIDPSSEVQGDGDLGKLALDPWIAREKGIGPDAPVSYESVAQDVGRQRERREGHARPAAPAARRDDPSFQPPPDPDDDIPF